MRGGREGRGGDWVGKRVRRVGQQGEGKGWALGKRGKGTV